MKNFKKVLSGLLAVSALLATNACTQSPAKSIGIIGGADGPTSVFLAGDTASGAAAPQAVIGVIQYAPHPSLDNCYEGFRLGLAEAGYEEGKNLQIDFQNAQGDMANSDIAAKNMISKKYSLVAGIATPAAMSAYSAAKQGDTPVVFTAVSDPVAAGIVKTLEQPGTNCTGTCDLLPLEEQVKMIRAFLPDAKKIGILYTTSEPNSVSQLERMEAIGKEYGFEIVSMGVTNASEVAAAAASITTKGIDCINNFTDNNVVNNLSSVLQAAKKAKIPVFGSEIEQVKNGCLASQGIDYVALGKETGKIAGRILSGEAKAGEIPVFTVKECAPVYNEAVMQELGLTLPEDYQDAEKVTN